MAKQLQLRRGTTSQHSTFTGANGEVTIDTDKKVVVVHDGATAGGIPLAKQDTVDNKVDKVASTDNAIVRFDGTTGKVQNSGVIIDDNGNIGVGISNPLSPLHIYKANVNDTTENRIQISRHSDGRGASLMQSYRVDSSSDDLMIAVDNANSNDLTKTKYRISASGEHKFYGTTTSTERMRIDTAGNVGIGTTTPARKLEVQSYGVGAAGILRISGLAGSGSTTNASLLELSITGAGGGTVTQNLTARYNNGYEIATYFADRVSWRDNATNTQLFAIDSSGNALVTNSTGGLGYGKGAGGTVTQLTSKSTAVTLNKPTGQIIMNNAALAANTIVQFSVINSLITVNDEVQTWVSGGTDNAQQYRVWANPSNGSFFINVKNESGGSLSHAIVLNFQIRKGAIS